MFLLDRRCVDKKLLFKIKLISIKIWVFNKLKFNCTHLIFYGNKKTVKPKSRVSILYKLKRFKLSWTYLKIGLKMHGVIKVMCYILTFFQFLGCENYYLLWRFFQLILWIFCGSLLPDFLMFGTKQGLLFCSAANEFYNLFHRN